MADSREPVQVTIDSDTLSLLALYGEAVARHTGTLTADDHAILRLAVTTAWRAVGRAQAGPGF